jgi:hypothetical protein
MEQVVADPKPLDHQVADNSEHTLEQQQAREAEQGMQQVMRCECDNARCQGHFRRAFCIGLATHGIVPGNRETDPVRNLCDVCFDHTMASGNWKEMDLRSQETETLARRVQAIRGQSDADAQAPEDLDPTDDAVQVAAIQEARQSARMAQAERTARTEMAPEANPALDTQRTPETLRTSQAPTRDTEVSPINDDSLTSKIPVLPTPSEMAAKEQEDRDREARSQQEDAAQDNERRNQEEELRRVEQQRARDAERVAQQQNPAPTPNPPQHRPRRPGTVG